MARVMLYVQHLLGIGHLARAGLIGEALAEAGLAVTVASGGEPVAGLPGQRLATVALPPLRAADAAFSGLVRADGSAVDEAFLAARRDALLAAFERLRPDVLIVEAYPFARRQMRFELEPLLERARAAPWRPLVLASVRDIVQAKAPARMAETVATVNARFDAVLVHGDPGFVPFVRSFPLAAAIRVPVIHTGLVAPPTPAPAPERWQVVVSAGGGAAGRALLAATAGLAGRRVLVLTGPNLPDDERRALAARAAPGTRVEAFRPGLAQVLAGANLSVSQAGYNTVADILRAGCRAVLVPFAGVGETEQTMRAEALAGRGRARVVSEAELSPDTLAAAVAASLDDPPDAGPPIDLDGAAGTARAVARLLKRGRSP